MNFARPCSLSNECAIPSGPLWLKDGKEAWRDRRRGNPGRLMCGFPVFSVLAYHPRTEDIMVYYSILYYSKLWYVLVFYSILYSISESNRRSSGTSAPRRGCLPSECLGSASSMLVFHTSKSLNSSKGLFRGLYVGTMHGNIIGVIEGILGV